MDEATGQQWTAMMQQQAMMAAQAAVAQTRALGQSTDGTEEQIRLQRANLFMMLTLNIPEFEGETSTLQDFIDRGGALVDQLNAAAGDPATDKAIRQMLIGRVATSIRRQIGVTANTPWEEVVKRLKDQYGEARKPYQKQAVTLISSMRQRGETPSQFARRMEEGARVLRTKVYETTGNQEEAHQIMKVLDLLVSERICREMPERVKKSLKVSAERTTLSEVVNIVREEDEEFGEAAAKEDRWIKVEPRRDRGDRFGGYRDRKPKFGQARIPRREERPIRVERKIPPRSGAREERHCFQCGTKGHIARFCTYIARRGQNVYRPEPMDVNTIGVRKQREGKGRRYRWVRMQSEEAGTTDYSSETASSEGSESEVNKGGKEGKSVKRAKEVRSYAGATQGDEGKP